MTIAIDAGCLGVTDDRLKVGVYHFALNLLENLAKIDGKNKYLLYSFDPIPQKLLEKFDANWTNLVLRPKKGWLSLRLSAEFIVNKPDVFLGLGQALPLFHPAKNIVFVYDLAFELFPHFYKESYKKLRRQTKFAVKHADKIIAISNATKNDLVGIYDVDPRKIEVIYPGHPTGVPQAQHHPWGGGIAGLFLPYFLFVGSYKPGKNIPNIAKAFELFRKKIKKPYQLILAGSDYWGEGIEGYKGNRRIKMTGYVSGAELVRLYRGAAAFVSPSYYEGFGMPILEAMASGVPVIASNRGSIPEVVGKAALLADPDDVCGLAKAMEKVAFDDKLRVEMVKKGLERAKKFSWEKSARKLLVIASEAWRSI